MKHAIVTLATGALLLSSGAALAAPATVTNDLNLRSGPGTNYNVVGVLPGGSTVDVRDCDGNWCRVASAEGTGYASASYLDMGGRAYVAPPPAVVLAPDYPDYGYAYEPGYAWGPGVSFGFRLGGFDRGRHHYWRHHGWRHHR